MAAVSPWILFSLILTLCLTQVWPFPGQNPCSCKPSSKILKNPIPRERIAKCFIQKSSRVCRPAVVINTTGNKTFCVEMKTQNGTEFDFRSSVPSWILKYVDKKDLCCMDLISSGEALCY